MTDETRDIPAHIGTLSSNRPALSLQGASPEWWHPARSISGYLMLLNSSVPARGYGLGAGGSLAGDPSGPVTTPSLRRPTLWTRKSV